MQIPTRLHPQTPILTTTPQKTMLTHRRKSQGQWLCHFSIHRKTDLSVSITGATKTKQTTTKQNKNEREKSDIRKRCSYAAVLQVSAISHAIPLQKLCQKYQTLINDSTHNGKTALAISAVHNPVIWYIIIRFMLTVRGDSCEQIRDHNLVEVLLYVHRNRRLIRDGSPGRSPRLSHSS